MADDTIATDCALVRTVAGNSGRSRHARPYPAAGRRKSPLPAEPGAVGVFAFPTSHSLIDRPEVADYTASNGLLLHDPGAAPRVDRTLVRTCWRRFAWRSTPSLQKMQSVGLPTRSTHCPVNLPESCCRGCASSQGAY